MIEKIGLIEDDLNIEVEAADYEPLEKKSNIKGYSELDFRIIQDYGKLSNKDYSPFFRIVIWNGYKRFDLRTWDGLKPRKGITFTEKELRILYTKTVDFSDIYTSSNEIIGEYKLGEITAKIYNNIATLSIFEKMNKTWTKEVNIVNWSSSIEKKIDFRSWTLDYKNCSKGITLSFDEFKKLIVIINGIKM